MLLLTGSGFVILAPLVSDFPMSYTALADSMISILLPEKSSNTVPLPPL